MKRVFDFVIAGAGSAGCVLAKRLSQEQNATVCLIEAGGSGRSLFASMPCGNGFMFGNPRFDWCLKSVPQSSLNGRQIHYPRGKGLGGSSLINGMIYIRGTASDYDRWYKRGLNGWSYRDVLPYFRRSAAAFHRVDDPYHDTVAPLKVMPAGNYETLNERFVEAARQAGNPLNLDFNGATQRGVGQVDVTVWNGRRQSTRETYLRSPPPNLTVLTKSRVLKIKVENNRACALEVDTGNVYAEKEIIICLGAFGSPQILMLSGIGPASHLKEVRIPVIHNLAGVGSSLYDHPQMPIKFEITDPSLSLSRYQRADRAVAMGMRYLLFRDGPAAAPFWSSVLFHSLRDLDNPELEIYMTPMCVKDDDAKWHLTAENLFNIGNLLVNRGKSALPGIQFEVNVNRPKSFGTVRLASDDPFAIPRIDPAWFTEPTDMKDIIAGLREVRHICAQASLKDIIAKEISPGVIAQSDSELDMAVRNAVSTGHHPVSTCPMGTDDDRFAVLDEKLRVKGIDALRVVDASSFPAQIGGNTNAAVIMLAEKAADMILERTPPVAKTPGEYQ